MSVPKKRHFSKPLHTRRALISALTVIGTAVALVFFAGSARAVHDAGLFELDGNATNQSATPGDDWDNVCHQVTGSDCSTSNDTSGATAVDWTAEPNLNSSIFTGGGSKDPQDVSNWAWKDGAGGLPAKDNLLHGFAARYSVPPSSSCPSGGAPSCDVLYFGSDRYDNSGDAQQGFWFFQNPIALGNNPVNGGSGFSGVHKDGDLLLISDFSIGGTTSTITVYKWDHTCTKTGALGADGLVCGDQNLEQLATSNNANCKTAPANDPFCGLVNANTITMPWSFTDKSGTPGNGALNGEFYEGGVNLSLLGLSGECFASVASETRSSTSTTATLKDFVLGNFGKCETTVTTQESTNGAGTSIGTGSATVSDQATVAVTGASIWTGDLQFSLTGPQNTPLSTTQDIGGPITVNNTTTQPVQSADAHVTAVGHYCWSATFTSHTSGVPNGTDDGTNECFDVTPVTPTLATSAGGPVVLGNPISDTATLSGTANEPGTPAINPTTAGGPAGGSITFTAYGPDDCSTVAFTSSPVPVSGDGTYGPVSFTPTAIGTYHWAATYTGDAPNTNGTSHNLNCTDTNEDVVVRSVPSTISTAQKWLPNDDATVSAPQGGNLAGHVTFTLFPTNDCSGTAIYGPVDVAVSGASPQTVSTSNTTVLTSNATVSWQVSYTSTNPAQRSIPNSCQEQSNLTIDNGQPVSSP